MLKPSNALTDAVSRPSKQLEHCWPHGVENEIAAKVNFEDVQSNAGHTAEGSTVDSQWAAHKVSLEQLQLIKARTMYQMVEDIESSSSCGRRRIIFLTNAQAELIGGQPDGVGIQRLMQALEIPQPKLVISVLNCWGFAGDSTSAGHVYK